MIYIIAFSITIFILWLSSKCRGALAAVLAILGLSIPCFIAGVRDETVGVDVLTYAKWMFVNAQTMGLKQFMSAEAGIAAPGWNLFTWAATKLTGSLAGYLFCIEALCIAPIYLGLRRVSRNNEWIGILLWLLLEYAFTLNGMRQAVAMGIIFYAVNYVFERRPLAFTLWVLVACLFHQTAIIGLLLYPLARMGSVTSGFRRFFGRWTGLALFAIVSVCVIIGFSLGPRIVVLAATFKDSYRYQINHLGANDFSVAGAYLLFGVIVAWLITRNRFSESDAAKSSILRDEFNIVCLLSAVGCLAWQLDLISLTLGRVGYYGTVLIPYAGALLAGNGFRPKGSALFLTILLAVYFVVMTIVLEKAGAWPYTSSILSSWAQLFRMDFI